jgi:hypothetical protein
VTSARTLSKGNGVIEIGVDAAAVHDVLAGKVVGGFIIADRDEFQRVKQEMEDSINKETKFMRRK